MARLVIAEKPSLGRAIARAVGADRREGQTLRGGGYIVTWCHGHIVDLARPEDYEGEGWGGKWDLESLPMLPARFRLRVSEEDGARELFSLISRLLASEEVDEIVHAGDPDREGEGIVRRVLALAGNEKPVLRLWCSSMEPDALREAIGRMRPDSEYDGLAAAATGRAVADWLIGMNATRALTCLYGPLVNAGRVITALLRIVADRTRENAAFERVPYWVARAVVRGGAVFETERLASPDDAAALASAMEGELLSVRAVERRRSRRRPPRPYSLTAMQKDASRLLGMSAERSLAAAQALYEAGLQTYPRTDSEAISSAELPALVRFLESGALLEIIGVGAGDAAERLGIDPARAVDDAAVSGHPALMPTPLLTADVHASLPDDQRAVSALVCARLACSITDAPSVRERVRACGVAGGVEVSHSSTRVIDAGWEALMDAAFPPSLARSEPVALEAAEGASLAVESAGVRRGESEPPRLHTDETLLAAMENAGRLVDDPELKRALESKESHSGGIGTPATRTPAIARLIEVGYIERVGGSIRATERGLWADSLAPSSMATPELTARWEAALDEVEAGRLPYRRFASETEALAAMVVAECRERFDPSLERRTGPAPLGPCPRCGEPMVRSRDGGLIRCTSRKYGRGPGGSPVLIDEGCGYAMRSEVCGHRITDDEACRLLRDGRVRLTGLKPKAGGRAYSATLVVDPEGRWPTRLEVEGAAGGAPPRGGRPRGSRGRRR